MTVPMVNLRSLLEETRPEWTANLSRLFERMQFIQGEEVACFEQELARSFGSRFAVATGTGTAAIELSLRAAEIEGREILLPALTSLFTAQAVLAARCIPRFADIHPGTLLLDVADVERRITPATAAIIPVHLYGQPCPMRELSGIARRAGLTLVQDSCQAHGARHEGVALTRFSPCVAYSFYPTKNLGCLGDGGAVLTDRSSVAERLRLLRDGGRRNGQVSRLPAINSRLDEMQACYLRAFLPRLTEWNLERARIAALYDEALSDCPGIERLRRSTDSVNHLYVIRARRRDRLRAHLAARGISTAVHYPVPLHLQPAFREFGPARGRLPNAEKACREIVSLPLWPKMPLEAVVHVAESVRTFYKK